MQFVILSFGICDEAGNEMHLGELKDGYGHLGTKRSEKFRLKNYVKSEVRFIDYLEGEEGGVLIFYD